MSSKASCINATYHLRCYCTHSFSLPPTFPFRFGTMETPPRVQVWGRIPENTLRLGIQTSSIMCTVLSLYQCQIFSYLLQTLIPLFGFVWWRSALSWICGVSVQAWIAVCLIGIVSISKRPDSHPHKDGAADDAVWMSLPQLPTLVPAETERDTTSVRDTVNGFALEVLCVAFINTDMRWIN